MDERTNVLKDVDDFGDFVEKMKDFSRIDNSVNVKEKCLDMCQKYLSGKWTQLTVDDIEIKRVNGGQVNMVYYCKIVESMKNIGVEPQEVIVRFYGHKYDLKTCDVHNSRYSDLIVGLMAAENDLGPQLYGLSTNGEIMKYYPHKHFNSSDLYATDLLDQLASKLAQFHAMKPPLVKKREWFQNILIHFSEKHKNTNKEMRKLMEENNCKTLLECDLKSENIWIANKIKSFDSPVVFSHNDFRFGNIMISEEKRVILSDFEYSDYYYRGYDFASLFATFNKSEEKTFVFKDESIVKAFISSYIRENEKLFGKQYSDNKINSIEHILKETKLFSLAYSLFVVNMLILNKQVFQASIDDKTILTMSTLVMDQYLATKDLFVNNKIILL